MRYASVESTTAALPNRRKRLAFFVCAKCRRPACERKTLPVAVILNRLATDFLVLMPLGRRINQINSKLENEGELYVPTHPMASLKLRFFRGHRWPPPDRPAGNSYFWRTTWSPPPIDLLGKNYL